MTQFGDDLINAMTEVLGMTDLDKLIEAVEGGEIDPHNSGAFKAIGFKHMSRAASAYRGSLDAAKALHDALLPGWEWYLDSTVLSCVCLDSGEAYTEHSGVSDNPARSWLIAILKAYRSTL